MNVFRQSPNQVLGRSKVMDRRHWLRGVGGAIGGAAVGSVRRRVAGEVKDRMRLGAIGVGNRGLDNAKLAATEQIVAICDVDQRYLAAAQERFPDATAYQDFRELLAREQLDGVVISTPDHTHFPAAITALMQGKHVYCEKPLTHSIAEARALAAVAAKNKVVTQLGNQHHSSAGYRRAVDWLRSGVLGELREVHAWTNRPIWDQGIPRPSPTPPVPDWLNWDLWLGPAPDRPYHDVYHPLGWRGWWDFGGGALADMGPHLLDPVVWALDLKSPVQIIAESGGGTDESAPVWSIVRYTFSLPQQRTLPITWYDGGKTPPREVTDIRQLPPNGVLVIAGRAKLFIPELGDTPVVIPHDRSDRVPPPEPITQGADDHHQEWILACKGQGSTSSPFDYGARLTEICLLGNLAIRTGKRLAWDDSRMSFPDAPEANALLRRSYRPGWPAIPTS